MFPQPNAPEPLTLWRNPIITMYYFTMSSLSFVNTYASMVLPVIVGFVVVFLWSSWLALFISYWILLGFLSSAGIGFGFHTFVLYVLPAISSFCVDNPRSSFLDTFLEFAPVIYCWGFGSALGECTSYVAGYFGTEKYESPRVKNLLRKHSFLLITVSGSIPNNFFDVLGIVAGATRLPFIEFFAPTVLGKAIIKPTIQLAITVVLLNKHARESLLSSLPENFQYTAWSWFDSYDRNVNTPSEWWAVVITVKDVVVVSLVAYFTVKGITRVANAKRDGKWLKDE